MKLAISNIAWNPAQLNSALDIMVDAGARGLEFAPGLLFPDEPDPFKPSADAVSRLDKLLEARGIALVSMQSLLFGVQNAHLFGTESETAAFIKAMQRAIGLAGQLGVPNLVFGSPKNRIIGDGRADKEQKARDIFRKLGDAAAAAGTKIALEPNPAVYGTDFLNTIDEAYQFCVFVDHPAVTVNFDIGSIHLNGEFAEVASLFRKSLPRVSHVHISEPQLAPAPKSQGEFEQAYRAISATDYAGWYSIEMREPAVSDPLKTVSECLQRTAAVMQAQGIPND
ncbi:sugar phosphate isomerase/epimerase family protein [Henriciella mobilis]|uniref:Sugar phosphate isomerase/epimerase n=1 Tax=Henriciella mobilis TaxID=2305467 RepID=A0A399RR31_9PROT|nr:sugar phosphate isomerase/epimerase family protein [Henriciella mobilis]RIJ32322.1 sugar phosphate isomerase/epimerase [Henriciella mobilis]